MRVTKVQRELLNGVVRGFLDTKEPALRISLVKKVKDPEIIDSLVPVILRNPNGDRLFPTSLAFECCGNAEALHIGKKSVEAVIVALKELFDSDQERVEFSFGDIEKAVHEKSEGTGKDQTLLGLYFAQEFGEILAGLGGTWPNFVSVKIHERIGLLQDIAGAWDKHVAKFSLFLGQGVKTSQEEAPKSGNGVPPGEDEEERWDFFISHASEDKEGIARPLAEALLARGARVWYDDFTLTAGDSLRERIDFGLSRSRFGIVIFSHHFFAKDWTKKELNGLAGLEIGGRKIILPVWHGIGAEEVRTYSPIFADKLAVKSDKPLDYVVEQLLVAAGMLRKNRDQRPTSKPTGKRPKPIISEVGPLDWAPFYPSYTTLSEKPKRGRRTIPDNFLLGARNDWVGFLEEHWPAIGWDLLRMREEKNSSLEAIRATFEKLKNTKRNSGLVESLYRESSHEALPSDVRRDRRQLGEVDAEILRMQAEASEGERRCVEAESALKTADPDNESVIREELGNRKVRLEATKEALQKLQAERERLDKKVRDQEAYVYRSELLNFLHVGRSPVNPRELGDALAGLPRMQWPQSAKRCASMPFNSPRSEYNILGAIAEIWSKRPKKLMKAPVDFFRNALVKRTKKEGSGRQFLRDNWLDFENAIKECWEREKQPGPFPFVLTYLLMEKATMQKSAAERILAERGILRVVQRP